MPILFFGTIKNEYMKGFLLTIFLIVSIGLFAQNLTVPTLILKDGTRYIYQDFRVIDGGMVIKVNSCYYQFSWEQIDTIIYTKKIIKV